MGSILPIKTINIGVTIFAIVCAAAVSLAISINTPLDTVKFIDPSEYFRPEAAFADKPVGTFRDYTVDPNDALRERVRKTYLDMHTHQTVEFVKGRLAKWTKFDTMKADIMTTLDKLNDLIDESDPDADIPNIVHAFQTAERIRLEHPDEDWFHLTGLIHDLGKIMAFYGEPQWAVVGDTFPVGCEPQEGIVYRNTSFHNNPDMKDERYNTTVGIYHEGIGLSNIMMSWGHDEYLYRVLKHNKISLPEQAFYMIRFHSFYPWHSNKDYTYFCDKTDMEMLPWVLKFNEYDLYTKSTTSPDIPALKSYYQGLVDKYMPGELEW